MALQQCKECGNEVSTKAKKCPHCGVRNPTVTAKQAWAGFLVFLLLVGGCVAALDSVETSAPPLTAEEQARQDRETQLSDAFSAWDGSHKALTLMIKDSMNDPNSYEHIATRYIDRGETLFVITEFRGKNAFGGMVKTTVRATTNALTGEVIEIISQD